MEKGEGRRIYPKLDRKKKKKKVVLVGWRMGGRGERVRRNQEGGKIN